MDWVITLVGKSVLRLLIIGVLFAMGFPADALEAAVTVIDLEPNDSSRDRTVPVRIYLGEQLAPTPIVLFSHGLGGSRKNNKFLGESWAADGFVCVFIQHAGSDDQVWRNAKLRDRMTALKAAASYESLLARIGDVSFTIDELERWNKKKDHPLFRRLDVEKIGMSGHSFGAVTTLAVAGRKFPFGKNYAEKRIDAFLALSPQIAKGMSPKKTFGDLRSPILCMTGTKDGSPIDPRATPESRRKVYEALPPDNKYELVFDGGQHHSFGDSERRLSQKRDPQHHPAIVKISGKFWNTYLKDDPQAKKWLQSEQARNDCELKRTDLWQWK